MSDPTPETTPTRDEAALLTCPFCGGANLKARVEDIDGWIAHIECTDCDDMTGPMSEFKYPEKSDAIADASRVWNRRASAPAPASGRVDAVARAIFDRRHPFENWAAFDERFKARGNKLHPMQEEAIEDAKIAIATLASLSPAATPVSEAKAIGREMADEIGGGLDAPASADKPYAQFRAEHLGKPAAGGDVRRVRHKKRGGIYEVLGEAQVQTSRPLEDYEVVVIYRSLNTPDIDDPASPMKGDTWARPKAEFNDGRFEDLSQSTSAGRVGE